VLGAILPDMRMTSRYRVPFVLHHGVRGGNTGVAILHSCVDEVSVLMLRNCCIEETRWAPMFLVRGILASLMLIGLFSAPSSAATYESFKTGTLKGKLIVQWWAPDQFLFLPDKNSPLIFTRSNGDTIVPGRMFTDGGSVPRPLWVFRNYSPWGYAPAFIVHDWLFHAHHCKLTGHDKYNHEAAATVMAEVVKTMMETKVVDRAELTVVSMHAAVNSSIADGYWRDGKCIPPPPGLAGKKPIAEFQLVFP
jgi:hypothetical protein